jgi:hypothetical protein
MPIFRLEDEYGNGVTSSGNELISKLIISNSNPDRRNDFDFLTGSLPWRCVRFGFSTKEALIEWFTYPLVIKLLAIGFTISVYYPEEEAYIIGRSKTQLMFDVDRAKIGYKISDRDPCIGLYSLI